MASGHGLSYKMHGQVQRKDPGASSTIKVDQQFTYINLVSTAAQSRTLGRPTRVGAEVLLHFKTDGGDITLTVTGGYNEAGDTTLVFNDAGQVAKFVACYDGSSYFWRLVYSNAVTSSPGIVTIADGTTYTLLAVNSGKVHTIPDLTASITITTPAVRAGLSYKFVYRGVAADAQNWVIDTGSNTNFFLGGLVHLDADAGAASDELVAIAGNGSSNSKLTVVTPNVGTEVNLYCDGTNWILSGSVLSATVPSFADQ
jgi:hypothetical protein